MSNAPPLPVLLLPADAPSETLVRAVEQAGARRVYTAGEAQVALVDLSHPWGREALRSLPAPGEDGVATLAVVEAAPALGDGADADEYVTRAALEAELPLRLQSARERHAARVEARQRERELSNLLRITADFAASLDVRMLLHDVVRRLAVDMDIERAALVALDEPREAGFIVAASDDAALKERRIDLSRYPEIREVVRTGEPVVVENAPTHPLLEGVKEHVTGKGIHTIAALPLSLSGKVLGVLLLRANRRRRVFSESEVDFLRTVAHATAVALRNVRLLEQERGLTEKEKHARLRAEERAADLARYEGYFAHLTEGVAIVDERSRVLSLNPAGAEMLDVLAHDMRGLPLDALTSPGDGRLAQLLCDVAKGQVRHAVELAVTTVAGRRLTLSFSGAQLLDQGGASILSFRDVTAQRTLADELRQTKEFLERLIDASVDAIIAADLSGRIIVFNKGAEAITGYTADEAKAQLQLEALHPPGVAQEVLKRLREDPRGQVGLSRQEVITRKGEKVPVDMTAAIVFEGGREVATVGVFSDLRDRMELEQKLSTAEERLEESEKNAVIVALAGTAAHELNQPLTSVMGYAELLKRRLHEEDFAWRPVEIIYREAERMAEIVRKIGKITRYETKSYVGAARILDLEKASSSNEE